MIIDKLISTAYAASNDLNLGYIEGVGKFQAAVGLGPASICSVKVTFGNYVSNFLTVITIVGGLAFVIYFILAAFKWITSSDDKGKVQEAQTQMTQGAIGLIAITVAYFIVGIIGAVMGLDILNPITVLLRGTLIQC